MMDALASTVERLERILDQEETLLLRHETAALDEITDKKAQVLLELGHIVTALRGIDPVPSAGHAQILLAQLRGRLEVNRTILEMHLRAVREVASIIARAIEEQESDGTYGMGAGRMEAGR